MKNIQAERQYQKERREWLKSHGICVCCGKRDAWSGRTLCEICIEKRAAYDARRNSALTPQQRLEKNERSKAAYNRRKESGKCVDCGAPATVGMYCLSCSVKRKKRHRNQYESVRAEREYVTVWEERRVKNLCHLCGKQLPENNPHGRMCEECTCRKVADLQKDTEANRLRKERARAVIRSCFVK